MTPRMKGDRDSFVSAFSVPIPVEYRASSKNSPIYETKDMLGYSFAKMQFVW